MKRSHPRMIRKILKTVVIVLAVMLVLAAAGSLTARLLAPAYLESVLNERMHRVGDYTGSVGSVSLNLLGTSAVLRDVRLVRADGEVAVPFLKCPEVHVAPDLKALLGGRMVGFVKLSEPVLNFVRGQSPSSSQLSLSIRWYDLVRDMLPFRINVLTVEDGEVHFRDLTTDPRLDLYAVNVRVRAENLRNIRRSEEVVRPARAILEAGLMRSGLLRAQARFDPLTETPPFDLTVEVDHLELEDVNSALRAFTELDVKEGRLDLQAEFTGRDGQVEGVLRPVVRGADIFSLSDIKEGPFSMIWEAMAGLVADMAGEARGGEQVIRVEIPVSGDYQDSRFGTSGVISATLAKSVAGAFQSVLKAPLEFITLGVVD